MKSNIDSIVNVIPKQVPLTTATNGFTLLSNVLRVFNPLLTKKLCA